MAIISNSGIPFDNIDDAVRKNFYVEMDENKVGHIELAADYRDTNDFLFQTAYDHRRDAVKPPSEYADVPDHALEYVLRDKISDAFSDGFFDTVDNILREAGFDPSDDHARDYLYEGYVIDPPFDHFLDQTMRVNIMLKTPADSNLEYALIHYQFLAMARPDELSDSSPEAIRELLSEDSSLKRLVEQQGHTMDELSSMLKDYMRDFYDPDGHPAKYRDENGKSLPYETRIDLFTAGKSKFLSSLCEELDNQTYSCGCITVLAEVSMKDFAEMMKPGKEITMPSDCHLGIFDPWNGAGSILGIYLAKPLVIRSEDIYDIQIEGADLDFGYSLDSTFGMVRDCWKSPVSICDQKPSRKPSLDNLIQSAEKVRTEQLDKKGSTISEQLGSKEPPER